MKAILIVVIFPLIAGSFTGCETKEHIKPRTIYVKTATLGKNKPFKIKSFPGITNAFSKTKLSFNIPGRITNLNVKVGQKVKKGDIIATLSKNYYDSFSLISNALLFDATSSLARMKQVIGSRAISPLTYDNFLAWSNMAKGMNRLTNTLLHDTTLYAPFTGYIDRKFVNNFETVMPGMPIVSLLSYSKMDIVFSISQLILSQKNLMKEFHCILSLYPSKVFKAEFKEMGIKPSPATNTYPVKVTITNMDYIDISPGMTATVYIKFAAKNQNIFDVPCNALTSDIDNNPLLWIYNKNNSTVSKIRVELLELSSNGVTVSGNLKVGDIIVTEGRHFLTEGLKVKLSPQIKSKIQNTDTNQYSGNQNI